MDGKERCIDDEIPYEIPENWAWTRLHNIAAKITDGEHKTPQREPKFCGYYLLSARNILDTGIQLQNVDYINKDEYSKIAKRCNPRRGDILLSCSGSVGRCCIINDDNQYAMVRSAAMISPISVNADYLLAVIQSSCVQKQIEDRKKQTAQANLFQDAIRNLLIPFPPLKEQRRICEKLKMIRTLLPIDD